MKKYLIVLASGLLLATTAALADPPQWRGQGGQQGQYQQQDGHRRHGDHDRRDNRGYRTIATIRDDRNDRYQYDRNRYVRDDRGVRDHRGRYYIVHDRGRHEGWYKRGGVLAPRYRETPLLRHRLACASSVRAAPRLPLGAQ